MPVIPGICDNCGNVFPSGIFVENSVAVFEGNEVGPCPYCRGWGHVPDGTFRVVQGAIELISAPQRTLDELVKLNLLLRRVTEADLEKEKVFKKIEKETPQFSPLLEFLKNEDFRFWLPVILSILSILIPLYATGNTEEPDVEINQVINHIYQQPVNPVPALTSPLISNAMSSETKAIPIKVEKIGRNAACPCGSGIKYKRCHGVQ
ncbi:SEC-C metal-binding domain-containing protein [Planococcus plakortidis]